MQRKTGTITLELRCSSCRQSAVHDVTYASESLRHLRCRECRAVNVYVFEALDETGTSYTRVDAVLQGHPAVMQQRGAQDLLPYDTTGSYAQGQYIVHSTYGEGYVLDVFGPPMKMSVLFADRVRLHVCGSGSTISVTQPRARKRAKPAQQAKPRQPGKTPRPRSAKA